MADAAVPNEDAAQGYLGSTEAEASADEVTYELQLYDNEYGDEGGAMSLFYLAKVDWQDVKSAALAGCVSDVRGGFGLIKMAFRAGLPWVPAAVANAALAAGGLCAIGAAVGGFVAWAAFK